MLRPYAKRHDNKSAPNLFFFCFINLQGIYARRKERGKKILTILNPPSLQNGPSLKKLTTKTPTSACCTSASTYRSTSQFVLAPCTLVSNVSEPASVAAGPETRFCSRSGGILLDGVVVVDGEGMMGAV
jgi:hypothetical protein